MTTPVGTIEARTLPLQEGRVAIASEDDSRTTIRAIVRNVNKWWYVLVCLLATSVILDYSRIVGSVIMSRYRAAAKAIA